jgi:hypothetical protein
MGQQPGVDVGYFSYLFKSHCYIRALQSPADFIRDGLQDIFLRHPKQHLGLLPAVTELPVFAEAG